MMRISSIHTRFLHIFFLVTIFLFNISGCQKPENDVSEQPQSLIFNVNDSLVSRSVVDSLLLISYKVPREWNTFSHTYLDSACSVIKSTMSHTSWKIGGINQGYFDSTSSTAFLVIKIDTF